jgi:hypothetical protein
MAHNVALTDEGVEQTINLINVVFPFATRENSTLIPLTVSTKGNPAPLMVLYPATKSWKGLDETYGGDVSDSRREVVHRLIAQDAILAADPVRKYLHSKNGTSKVNGTKANVRKSVLQQLNVA